MIYLDNAATTRITPEVFEAMKPYLIEQYGNPSSLYKFGREAKNAIERAREQIAKAINAEPEQIIFTSGATESNNWVLSQYDKWILCSQYEHHSVLKRATPYKKEDIIKNITKWLSNCVSCMMVNNETGETYKIKEIIKICHQYSVPFHTDATQAFGHIPIDVKDLDIDYLSLSAHKFHAPSGVGILYVKDPSTLKPIIFGGYSQEFGLRGGTENVASIVAMGKAAEIYNYRQDVENKIRILRDNFEKKILDNVPKVLINAKDRPRTANISSLSFKGIEGEALMLMLDTKGICVSSGSACNSGSLEPSHVLKAMGVPEEYINGTIRVSLSEFTTAEELDFAADEIIKTVKMLR